MPVDDSIRIEPYEDRMLEQVAELFAAEYGTEGGGAVSAESLQARYRGSYQKKRAISLVALDGDTVCGFQAYVAWPYTLRGQTLAVFQSGNSLVSPDYRGRGIFGRLLNYIYESDDRPPVDLMVGFPVGASFGSFLRTGWSNPVDLRWSVRPLRIVSPLLFGATEAEGYRFETKPEVVEAWVPNELFCLDRSEEFWTWRAGYRAPSDAVYYFHFSRGTDTVRFALKRRQRGRLGELVVGDICRSSGDPALLAAALKELIRVAKAHRSLAFLSIATNPHSREPTLQAALRKNFFVPTNRSFHFIVKNVDFQEAGPESDMWQLLPSDLDTW